MEWWEIDSDSQVSILTSKNLSSLVPIITPTVRRDWMRWRPNSLQEMSYFENDLRINFPRIELTAATVEGSNWENESQVFSRGSWSRWTNRDWRRRWKYLREALRLFLNLIE
jgi:hypothetical protein